MANEILTEEEKKQLKDERLKDKRAKQAAAAKATKERALVARAQYKKVHYAKKKEVNFAEDATDRPSGGSSVTLGVNITWQNGARGQDTDERPNGEQMPNGASVEDVLEIASDRLKYLNYKLPSDHNLEALSNIEQARMHLVARKVDRNNRGVQGLDKE